MRSSEQQAQSAPLASGVRCNKTGPSNRVGGLRCNLALHLDQPGHGASEFEGAVASDIDFFRRHFGRGDQQGARLTERVYQDVEPPGLSHAALG